MSDNAGFPIDIQAAKNTKLFKKFMQSKNKSMVAPSINHVVIQNQNHEGNHNSSSHGLHPVNSTTKIESKEDWYQGGGRQEQKTYKIDFEIPPAPKKLVEAACYRKTEGKDSAMDDDTDYRKKYERMVQDYEQLKGRVAVERKQNKKELLKLQQQLQLSNKKFFEVSSHEDELILENKRLKEKTSSEVKGKQQIEQQNRQLVYQVQELKDILEGQERATKRRQEEAAHWRKQNQQLKIQIKDLLCQNQKLQDFTVVLERQKIAAIKDTGNKDTHMHELREKINSLISDNSDLRDQVFQFTNKLFHLEQQNTSLRAELRRYSQQMQHTQFHDYSQALGHPRVHSHYEVRPQPDHQTPNEKQEKRNQRRRGQFARERGQKKIDNFIDKTPINAQKQIPASNQRNEGGQKMRRLEDLNKELQKILDMKALNGNLRRQKIGIQRQIAEIQDYFRSKNQS